MNSVSKNIINFNIVMTQYPINADENVKKVIYTKKNKNYKN